MGNDRARQQRAEELRKAGYFDPHYDPGGGMFGLTPAPEKYLGDDAPLPPPRQMGGMAPARPQPPWWYALMLRQRQGETVNGAPVGSPFDNYVDGEGRTVNPRYWEAVDALGRRLYAAPWEEVDAQGNRKGLPWEGGVDSLGNPIWIDVFQCGPSVPADRRQAPPVFPAGWPADRKPPWLR